MPNDLKPIPGHTAFYASESGEIWRRFSYGFRQLRGYITRTGYHRVNLRRAGTSHYIHRLIAVTFLNPPADFQELQVRHMDGDKQNNAVSNLRWGTCEMNIEDREHHKRIAVELTTKQRNGIERDIWRGYDAEQIAEAWDASLLIVTDMLERCVESDWYF